MSKLEQILSEFNNTDLWYLRISQLKKQRDMANDLGITHRHYQRCEYGGSPVSDKLKSKIGEKFKDKILSDEYFVDNKKEIANLIRNIDGEAVRYLRSHSKILQGDIARKIGVNVRTLQRFEKGLHDLGDIAKYKLVKEYRKKILDDPYFDKYLRK